MDSNKIVIKGEIKRQPEWDVGCTSIIFLTQALKTPQHHIYIVVSGDVYNNFIAPVFFGDSGDDNGTKLGIWGFSEGLWWDC